MAKKYLGMTVNERLYVADLLDAFQEVIKQKDTEAIISILKKVELNDASIEPILVNHGLLHKGT